MSDLYNQQFVDINQKNSTHCNTFYLIQDIILTPNPTFQTYTYTLQISHPKHLFPDLHLAIQESSVYICIYQQEFVMQLVIRYNIAMQGKGEKNKEKQQIPKGRTLYQVGGTQFVVDQKYQIIKQIGSGAYGVVASALDREKNKKVAIKKVLNAFEDLIDAKRIVREIKLLKFFKHDNIIGLVDILKPQGKTGYTDIYIITELMETDLHRVIYSRQDLSEDHIQYFTYQILRGLLFMHSANVLHRDLKPGNLLLNKSCDLKICDLGLARGYVQEEEEKTEYVITRWYRAPQVILNASEYSKAVDIWSVGCIFAELLGRQPLFPGEDFLDQVQRIISVLGTPSAEDMKYIGNDNAIKYIKSLPKRSKQSWQKLFPNIKPTAADILSKMLSFNPDKRYTVEQCLAHPYFDGLHDEQQEIISKKMFDWNWDSFKPTKDLLQNMVYEESLFFHPETVTEQPKKAKRDLKEFAYGSKYKFYQ